MRFLAIQTVTSRGGAWHDPGAARIPGREHDDDRHARSTAEVGGTESARWIDGALGGR